MCRIIDHGCLQIEVAKGLQKKQTAEMELLHQLLEGAKEELKEARLRAEEQKDREAIIKQKYTAAMQKVHEIQGRVDVLEEELRYSQQEVACDTVVTHKILISVAF